MEDEIHRVMSRPRLTARYTASSSCDFQPHSHSTLTVTAVLSGHLSATIGEARLSLGGGQVAFTNIGQNHSGNGRNIKFVSIGIEPAMVAEVMADMGQVYSSTEMVFRAAAAADEAISS